MGWCRRLLLFCCALAPLMIPAAVWSHGVTGGDALYLQSVSGVAVAPFLYLGAKHMVTGYDHLLFIFGVIFFLYRIRDVALYATLFTIGHSLTLLVGVLGGIQANAYLVDAIIGFSVVYKGFDNLGGFRQLLGYQPDTRIAVLIFGFFHGFGLATKIQEFNLSTNGLAANIISFNLGVELGQVVALTFFVLLLGFWRRKASFMSSAFVANSSLMAAGWILVFYQLSGYLLEPG